MKFAWLIAAFWILPASVQQVDSDAFDKELSGIVSNYQEGIMNEESCTKLLRKTKALADKIEAAMEEGDYSTDELTRLRILHREALAVEAFIACVSEVGEYMLSQADFNIANARVGARTMETAGGEACVGVIRVFIGEYVAYMLKNDSEKNYSVDYDWEAPRRASFGLWQWACAGRRPTTDLPQSGEA